MAVKSAERVFQIFELLENSSNGMTNKEISEALKFAPSSTLGILQTMLDYGYLMVSEGKRYSLGGKLVRLGDIAASRFDIGKMSAPYLKHLMNTLKETCFLAVLSGDEIVYIAKERCEQTINTNANIGSRKPVYCTGLGKSFLAFLPEKESKEIIDQIDFEEYTHKTVKNKEDLEKQLEEFRAQGYAIDDQEIEEGLWCAAVPIYDGSRRMVAAISVSGPIDRMIPKKEKIIQELLNTSKCMSEQLGYHKEEKRI